MNSGDETMLAERIRAAREGRGLSRAQVADAVGISPSYVEKLERGHSIPTVDVAGRLAKVLGIPHEAFFREARTADELESELAELLGRFEVSVEAHSDLLGTNYAAKRAFVSVLREAAAKMPQKGASNARIGEAGAEAGRP